MSSNSGSNGVVQIQVTFEIGSNADQAALNVNNRVKQAEARLPEEVRRQGVTVEKGSSAFLMVYACLFAGQPLRRSVHQQLRDAQRAGLPQARTGHHQRADLRRQGLRDAHLGQARPHDAAQAHAGRSDSRGERAERAVRGGQGGTDADRAAAGTGLHHHHQGAAGRRQGVRRDHRALQPGRLRRAPEGRGAHRAGGQGLRVHRPGERQAGHAAGYLPAAGRQRAGGGRRVQRGDEAAVRALSRRV